jgi:hypothetical protein
MNEYSGSIEGGERQAWRNPIHAFVQRNIANKFTDFREIWNEYHTTQRFNAYIATLALSNVES